MNPLIWINDDEPELGADVPLERCLSEARSAGYAGIELGHRFPTGAGELRPLLARHALALVSGWYGARLAERGVEREWRELRPHVELLREMRCGTLVFGETSGAVHKDACGLSRRPVLAPAALDRYARELDRLARRVGEEGVRLALHHHVGTVIETPDEIDRVMERTSDAVGLTLDTGHLAWGGGGPAAIARVVSRHVDRITHVHLKDVRARVLARVRREDAPFLDAVRAGVFTVPGDGSLPLGAVVAALARRRYEGWIVVEAEQDPRRAHPLTYARLGFANAARLVAEHARAVRARAARVRRSSGETSGARSPHARAARPRGAGGRRPRA